MQQKLPLQTLNFAGFVVVVYDAGEREKSSISVFVLHICTSEFCSWKLFVYCCLGTLCDTKRP